jgi:hypothetical protein
MKKYNTTKLEAANPTKKMPSSARSSHQNDCERRPNVERILAAWNSGSTPFCVRGSKWHPLDVRGKSTTYLPLIAESEARSQRVRQTQHGRTSASGKTRIVNFPIILNNFNNRMRVISVGVIISTCLPPSNLATRCN